MSEQPLQPCDGAQELLHVILEYVSAEQPVPTRAELAEQFNVTTRTIDRWIQQLRYANLLLITGTKRPRYRIGNDRELSRMIGESAQFSTILDNSRSCPFCSSPRPNSSILDLSRSHGGGGGISSDGDSTTTNPAARPKIYTETGRYLVERGFSRKRAAQFQHIPLDVARADVERRWAEGARQGAIVEAWDVAPPTELPPATSGAIDLAALRERYGDLFVAGGDEGDDDAAE